MSDGDIDMVNRDPNGINAHLGVRSFDTYYLFIIIIVIVNFDDITLKIKKNIRNSNVINFKMQIANSS